MIYGFGQYELDTSLYEFRLASALETLEPKVFDVLLHLIEHRERVVSKDELFEHLWPDPHIAEAMLTHAIMSARKAAGDDGRRQGVIQTLQRRLRRLSRRLLARRGLSRHATGSPRATLRPTCRTPKRL